MKVLYSLILLIIRTLSVIAGSVNERARIFVKGRRGFFKKFSAAFSGNTAPVIWVHCASLGEFEQGRPVIEKFKNEFPAHKILLTFFSPSGYEVRKNYKLADFVFYLPWDTKRNASRFIDISKPALAVFVKYEFWYHYTDQLKKRNIPLLSISAIFRKQQIFFSRYGGFLRKILKNFSWFFVQNDESARLLNSINISNVTRAGDTRFDRVSQLVNEKKEVPIAHLFKGSDKVMVIGSCWEEDLEILIPFINEHCKALKFIIAPHQVNETVLTDIEKSLTTKTIRFSKATNSLERYRVLLVDNVGLLGHLYRFGEFAYVGGAFGKGLHNILEPACYGVPIFFGNKNYSKFQEAVDLINLGGAFEVRDYHDLNTQYKSVTDPQNFLLACSVTRMYVEENQGATEKIMKYCQPLLTTS